MPHTLSDDGDPIDVLVANTRPIIPGAVMNVRPIGVLRMEDDGGGDEKIIAVPSSRITQRYVNVKTHTDLPEITRHQIERCAGRSSTSSSTTRISSPANG